MSRRYVMVGLASGEAVSLGGRILVHHSRPEMEFLFPIGVRVVEIGPDIPERDTMPLRDHPDLAKVRWPLRREDFR